MISLNESGTLHHFNESSLAVCFRELDGRKAVGIDGIDKVRYGENLDDNLKDLVTRMKRMAYQPAARTTGTYTKRREAWWRPDHSVSVTSRISWYRK